MQTTHCNAVDALSSPCTSLLMSAEPGLLYACLHDATVYQLAVFAYLNALIQRVALGAILPSLLFSLSAGVLRRLLDRAPVVQLLMAFKPGHDEVDCLVSLRRFCNTIALGYQHGGPMAVCQLHRKGRVRGSERCWWRLQPTDVFAYTNVESKGSYHTATLGYQHEGPMADCQLHRKGRVRGSCTLLVAPAANRCVCMLSTKVEGIGADQTGQILGCTTPLLWATSLGAASLAASRTTERWSGSLGADDDACSQPAMCLHAAYVRVKGQSGAPVMQLLPSSTNISATRLSAVCTADSKSWSRDTVMAPAA